MSHIFAELRKRHMLQVAVGYVAAGWIFIEATGFLVDNYELSRKLIDISVLLAALGFPAILTISWFHGARGHQRVQRAELWLLVTLAVLAGIGTYRISVAEDSPVEPAATSQTDVRGPTRGAQPVVASEDLGAPSIAVFPFRNNVSDPTLDWLGSGLADMLTTNFAQFPRLRVIGRQRLLDLMNEAGMSEGEEIPDNLATDLAQRSGAYLMVRGTVLGSANDLVIDAQLIELATGTVVAAERVRSDDLFAMVDTLSRRFGRRFTRGRPLELAGSAPPTVTVGTRDLAAYEAFHEGLVAEREGRVEDAKREMARAITLDSTFGLAALRLSAHEGLSSPEARRYLEMAFRSIERIPKELLAMKGVDVNADSFQILVQIDSLVSEALVERAVRLKMPPPVPGERPPRERVDRPPPDDGGGGDDDGAGKLSSASHLHAAQEPLEPRVLPQRIEPRSDLQVEEQAPMQHEEAP